MAGMSASFHPTDEEKLGVRHSSYHKGQPDSKPGKFPPYRDYEVLVIQAGVTEVALYLNPEQYQFVIDALIHLSKDPASEALYQGLAFPPLPKKPRVRRTPAKLATAGA